MRWRTRATRENVWSKLGKDKEIFSIVVWIETCWGWYTRICDIEPEVVNNCSDSIWVRVVVRTSGETTERFAFGIWWRLYGI